MQHPQFESDRGPHLCLHYHYLIGLNKLHCKESWRPADRQHARTSAPAWQQNNFSLSCHYNPKISLERQTKQISQPLCKLCKIGATGTVNYLLCTCIVLLWSFACGKKKQRQTKNSTKWVKSLTHEDKEIIFRHRCLMTPQQLRQPTVGSVCQGPFRCQNAFYSLHPLHAAIGKVCKGEKVYRDWTSFSSCLCHSSDN